jgi:predicted metalloprotease with PDZ domain
MYIPGKENEPCALELILPASFKVATSLSRVFPKHYSATSQGQSGETFFAADFHELADSPFIASASLKHNKYEVGGVKFHLWFQGECKPEWERLIPDFEAFTKKQLEMMGGFPVEEYHFLFQILTSHFYHGVEHLKSTVIALGPSYDLMKPILYPELLGISSHELFHSWNIKAIRPVDMQPYRYEAENFSKLGYVAEGITTYYGDLFLRRSKAYSTYEFVKELTRHLQKHLDNYGRFNLSVAASSFDTWLDGYSEGIPHRKVSIYTEGALCALIIDVLIRKNTKNKRSLDDAMQQLYQNFGKKGIGYTEADYQNILEKVAGIDLSWFFEKHYNGTTDYEPLLDDCLEYFGLQITKIRSRYYFENRFGFRVKPNADGAVRITAIAPNSLAEQAGLSKDDIITGINGIKLANNLKEWCKYFQEEAIELDIYSQNQFKQVMLTPTETDRYYRIVSIQPMPKPSTEQLQNLASWLDGV